MKPFVTAQQVAKLAKVSQSAVSRSFTEGASVSEATRMKVLATAAKLGYRPNAIARSLITRRSRMIGLVMSYLENQFYPLVIEKLSQDLQGLGYHVLLFIGEADSGDKALREILQYQVEGIIVASTVLSSELADGCARSGIPVLFFNRVPRGSSENPLATSSVTSDNATGGAMVGQVLLERGYRRIGFMAGLENSSTNQDRERGFKRTLAANGAKLAFRTVGNYKFASAQLAAEAMFSKKPYPDALFVANDHMAIAVMDVLRFKLGLRIPEDVGIVGFDDVPQAAWAAYNLCTVTQDVEAMVAATVELMLKQLEGDLSPQTVVVPCQWIERGSLRPAKVRGAAKAPASS